MAQFPMIIVNTTLPLLIQLKPNPNSISINRKKIYSKTQTLGGFVYEHWGEQPRELHIKGRTYPKLGAGAPFVNSELGVEAALLALQQLYNLDKRPLVSITGLLKNPASIGGIVTGSSDINALRQLSTTFIFYRNDAYQGFFTDFKYTQNAESNPRHYEYEFNFLVTNTAQSALTDLAFSTGVGSLIGSLAGLAVTGSQVVPLLKSISVKGFSGLNI